MKYSIIIPVFNEQESVILLFQSLTAVMDSLKENYEVVEAFVQESQEVREFWSSFVDIKIKFSSLDQMTIFCFDYMPSSVDILEPVKFTMESQEMNALFNDLMGKLHNYDMLLKNLRAENEVLKKRLDRK